MPSAVSISRGWHSLKERFTGHSQACWERVLGLISNACCEQWQRGEVVTAIPPICWRSLYRTPELMLHDIFTVVSKSWNKKKYAFSEGGILSTSRDLKKWIQKIEFQKEKWFQSYKKKSPWQHSEGEGWIEGCGSPQPTKVDMNIRARGRFYRLYPPSDYCRCHEGQERMRTYTFWEHN